MLNRLARWIEGRPGVHRLALRVWRCFPPGLAGFLKGRFARRWVVGAVAVMIDTGVVPPEVLLVEHSYRRRGAWGLPGGSVESASGGPAAAPEEPSPDDVIDRAIKREIREELGFAVDSIQLLRVSAVSHVVEEPGPYRLHFYCACRPEGGFAALRLRLARGGLAGGSPEILQTRLVPLTEIGAYDLFSSDAQFLKRDLPRLMPRLAGARP
jgi:8-oxo-dGTP pyrophosphatase MutT (NUDIX family)